MTNEIYPKNVSAPIVIDLLNDFLSERGKTYNNTKSELERVRGHVYAVSGDKAAASKVLKQLGAIPQGTYISPLEMARFMSGSAEKQRPSNGSKRPTLNVPTC